jgi:hypothetical protein
MAYPDPTELAKLHEAADDLLKPFNQSAPRYMEGETADGHLLLSVADLVSPTEVHR